MAETTNMGYQCINKQRLVLTPIGQISIISKFEAVPEGWRKLTLTEGQQIKQQLNSIIGHHSKVAFVQGSLDGLGYGNQFHNETGNDVHEVFIIKNH